MKDEMVVFLVNYSTADFEKTISAEDNPALTQANISTILFPPGNYRMVAGKLVRMVEGLPPEKAEESIDPLHLASGRNK